MGSRVGFNRAVLGAQEGRTDRAEQRVQALGGWTRPRDRRRSRERDHLSFSDSIFLPMVVPRRITFLAKADYFTGGSVKGKATASFMKGVGQVPVDRGGGRAHMAALNTGIRILRSGELLGLYPEGTRSPDGRVLPRQDRCRAHGARGGVPVLPTAMVGTDIVQPTGQKIPNRGKGVVRGIRIGAALDFSRYEGIESDRFVSLSVTDEIMYGWWRSCRGTRSSTCRRRPRPRSTAAKKAASNPACRREPRGGRRCERRRLVVASRGELTRRRARVRAHALGLRRGVLADVVQHVGGEPAARRCRKACRP